MTTSALTSPIDRALDELRTSAAHWVSLSAADKAKLLRTLSLTVAAQAERWALAAAGAKGIAGTPLEGEEWISGPWAVLYALNRYVDTLEQIERHGSPQIDPHRIRTRPDAQLVVDVFPVDFYDKTLLSGIRAEVWMQPGIDRVNFQSTLAPWYQQPFHERHVALVLGAGNISSIAPLDVIYKLVADGAVCMLKMNPVNDYLGPIFEAAFKPLVDAGYLRFAYGGAEVGKYLCSHPCIDEIHITGSDKTFDAIVYGDGPDAVERKRRNDPILKKPISSELGNVSPTIVVPGDWSDADIAFQAQNIVTQKMHNGGFNCVASQVLIVPTEWTGTKKLLDAVQVVMRDAIDRPAYYPGAETRHARLSAHEPNAQHHGRAGGGFVPRTLFSVEGAGSGHVVFRDEAFGSVLAVTAFPGETESYLEKAVSFANESLWGTLGGNIIVHPKTMREHAAAIDSAIANMRYGCVGVNAWTGVGYFIAETPWGAFPGHTIDDIQSGTGVVHNSHLFSRSEKSVVYAPFAPFPRSFAGYGNSLLPLPPWFITNKMSAKVGRALCEFETRKNLLTMSHVAMHAMRA